MAAWNAWQWAIPGYTCAYAAVAVMVGVVTTRKIVKQAGATGHPIVSSIEPGEDWSWCFVDELEVVLPKW
jgi:hypothetical protein